MPARSCPASGRLDTLIVRPGRTSAHPSAQASGRPSGRAAGHNNRGKHHPWPAELGRPDATAVTLRFHDGSRTEPAQVALARGNDWPVLLNQTGMAVALHRSGIRFRGTETPQDVAAAILTGLDRVGTDTVRAVADEIDTTAVLTETGEFDWHGHKQRAALLGGYRREGLLLALVHRVTAAAQH
jgi:hypothetical protein